MSGHYELPPKLRDAAMRESEEWLLAKHRRGDFDEGDPNHPKYNNGINYTLCLGLAWDDLMARQYTTGAAR